MIKLSILLSLFSLMAIKNSVQARYYYYPEQPVDPCTDACTAARETDGDTIRRYIEDGSNLCQCKCGAGNFTLLHQSVPARCTSCMESLIYEAECPTSIYNTNGDGPLHIAAAICEPDTLNVLLEGGADPNGLDEEGNTPLCRVALSTNFGCATIARDLVANGADVCMKCNGYTPFVLCEDPEVCYVIAESGGTKCY